jgi:hypothetical protein
MTGQGKGGNKDAMLRGHRRGGGKGEVSIPARSASGQQQACVQAGTTCSNRSADF